MTDDTRDPSADRSSPSLDLQGLIEKAFKAGYHCQWTGIQYVFDPLMSPGDDAGAFKVWRSTCADELEAAGARQDTSQTEASEWNADQCEAVNRRLNAAMREIARLTAQSKVYEDAVAEWRPIVEAAGARGEQPQPATHDRLHQRMQELDEQIAASPGSLQPEPPTAQCGAHVFRPDETGYCQGCGGWGVASHWGHDAIPAAPTVQPQPLKEIDLICECGHSAAVHVSNRNPLDTCQFGCGCGKFALAAPTVQPEPIFEHLALALHTLKVPYRADWRESIDQLVLKFSQVQPEQGSAPASSESDWQAFIRSAWNHIDKCNQRPCDECRAIYSRLQTPRSAAPGATLTPAGEAQK